MRHLVVFIFIAISVPVFSQQEPEYGPLVSIFGCKSLREVYKELTSTNRFNGTISIPVRHNDSVINGHYQDQLITIKKADTSFLVSLSLRGKKTYDRFLKSAETFFLPYGNTIEFPTSPEEPCSVSIFKNRDVDEAKLDIRIYRCPLELIKTKTPTYLLTLKPFFEFRCGNE
jgi:hypothetical protein